MEPPWESVKEGFVQILWELTLTFLTPACALLFSVSFPLSTDKKMTGKTASVEAFHNLGTAPDPDLVDEWLVGDLGLTRHVVGQSYLGRDLLAYSSQPDPANNATTTTTLLLLSLVHGNEPVGMLALLAAAEKLLSSIYQNDPRVNLVFFPFVNIDAYLANLPVLGCRRTNLHIDDHCLQASITEACPYSIRAGVDINRNFPADWRGAPDGACSPIHPGPHPFSEPETQAIRTVQALFQPTHFLSFHSRNDAASGPRLLIHPYGSSLRSFATGMDPERRQQYEEYNQVLRNGEYVAGTPAETIGYTAQGTTIDWMEREYGVYSYVVEVVPPTTIPRWCSSDVACWEEADVHATMSLRWLDMIVGGANNTTPGRLGATTIETGGRRSRLAAAMWVPLSFAVLLVAGAFVYFLRRRQALCSRRYRVDPF